MDCDRLEYGRQLKSTEAVENRWGTLRPGASTQLQINRAEGLEVELRHTPKKERGIRHESRSGGDSGCFPRLGVKATDWVFLITHLSLPSAELIGQRAPKHSSLNTRAA